METTLYTALKRMTEHTSTPAPSRLVCVLDGPLGAMASGIIHVPKYRDVCAFIWVTAKDGPVDQWQGKGKNDRIFHSRPDDVRVRPH